MFKFIIMKMKFYSFFTLVLVFLFSGLSAQEVAVSEDSEEPKEEISEFTLDGQFRTRFEYSPSALGRNILVPVEIAPDINTPSGASIWQRSRIIAGYKAKRFETNFSIQDVRPFLANKYGNSAPYWTSGNGNTLSVHEAWAKLYLIDNDFCSLGLKVGRQELKNSDGRLMWNREWNHYNAAYDAVALQGRNKRFQIDWDLVWALNSVDGPTTAETPFRNLVYMEVKKYIGDFLTINAIGMMETFEQTNNYEDKFSRNTLGINPVFKSGNFRAEGSFYKQMGLAGYTGADEEIKFNGMLYTVSAAYKTNPFIFGAGYDSYTGDAYDYTGDDNKVNQFTAVCWAGHKYYGNTDFHLKYGKNEGLTDIYVTAKMVLSKQTGLMLGFHNISFTNSPAQNASGDDIKALGNNIDFVFTHMPVKKVKVNLGYSVMLPSEDFVNMELGQDTEAKFHGWGWAMITFKPNFLKK